jgi:hypothetical protein
MADAPAAVARPAGTRQRACRAGRAGCSRLSPCPGADLPLHRRAQALPESTASPSRVRLKMSAPGGMSQAHGPGCPGPPAATHAEERPTCRLCGPAAASYDLLLVQVGRMRDLRPAPARWHRVSGSCGLARDRRTSGGRGPSARCGCRRSQRGRCDASPRTARPFPRGSAARCRPEPFTMRPREPWSRAGRPCRCASGSHAGTRPHRAPPCGRRSHRLRPRSARVRRDRMRAHAPAGMVAWA